MLRQLWLVPIYIGDSQSRAFMWFGFYYSRGSPVITRRIRCVTPSVIPNRVSGPQVAGCAHPDVLFRFISQSLDLMCVAFSDEENPLFMAAHILVKIHIVNGNSHRHINRR